MQPNQEKRSRQESKRRAAVRPVAFGLLIALCSTQVARGASARDERLLPTGTYLPFFPARAPDAKTTEILPRKPVVVTSFRMDVYPVTNEEFLKFVTAHPEWRRSKVGRVFADESYLKQWGKDLRLRSIADSDRPVTHVSWFAAAQFCHAQGKELPTTDQWEYAAEDAGRNADTVKERILSWYSAPNAQVLEKVKSHASNGYGIHDLHGLIWEWTLDFNSIMMSAESRSNGSKDDKLFCGSGSLTAADASDYAKFMRYSFRSSLNADYTTANLGFRCAREEKK